MLATELVRTKMSRPGIEVIVSVTEKYRFASRCANVQAKPDRQGHMSAVENVKNEAETR